MTSGGYTMDEAWALQVQARAARLTPNQRQMISFAAGDLDENEITAERMSEFRELVPELIERDAAGFYHITAKGREVANVIQKDVQP